MIGQKNVVPSSGTFRVSGFTDNISLTIAGTTGASTGRAASAGRRATRRQRRRLPRSWRARRRPRSCCRRVLSRNLTAPPGVMRERFPEFQASSSSASLFAKNETYAAASSSTAATSSATEHLSGVEAAKQVLRNRVEDAAVHYSSFLNQCVHGVVQSCN